MPSVFSRHRFYNSLGGGAGAGGFQSFSRAGQNLGVHTEDLDGGNLPAASVGVVPSLSEAPLATDESKPTKPISMYSST